MSVVFEDRQSVCNGYAKRPEKRLVGERYSMRKAQSKLPNNERLHKCRRKSRWYHELGRYYIVDDRNTLVAWEIEDLEELHDELTNARMALPVTACC